MSALFVRRGVPGHLRSDDGSEFTARCVREWLGRVGVRTLFIEPGSPRENGYCESFNGKLRGELLGPAPLRGVAEEHPDLAVLYLAGRRPCRSRLSCTGALRATGPNAGGTARPRR